MDPSFVLPIVAKKYQVSIICYNAQGSYSIPVENAQRSYRRGGTTQVYLYRSDGKVQCQTLRGYCKPWDGALTIYYNGRSHYNFVSVREDVEELSPPPNISQPSQPTSSQRSPPQNGATSPPKNSTTSHAASPPARPPATLYTPCKSPANLVHTNPFPTPIRNEILQYQPADPFVIVGGTTDPDLVMYESKGNYDSPKSRDEFNSILAVTLITIEGNETVVQLKWQRQKKRGFISDILRRTVLKKELFADHLNPLFPNGLEVLARHKIGNESKKFNESRSDHGFAAYTSGMCSHNAAVRRKNADIANKCPVKVVVGFTADDILSFMKNPSQTTIQLRIQVNENCLHKTVLCIVLLWNCSRLD